MLEVLPLEKCNSNLLKGMDIYYDKDYLIADEPCEDGQIFIALFKSDKGSIVYPFVKRIIKINRIDTGYYDICSPYEYGGPEANGEPDTFLFIEEFHNYCNNENIVSEFVRFNPLGKSVETFKTYYSTRLSNHNIVVDLRKDESQIFSEYHKNNRRDIRASGRKGVVVQLVENSIENLKIFREIYNNTMDKRDAKSFYYFNEEYFEKFSKFEEGKLSLFIARNNDGIPISSAMFLHGYECTHYHLSGNNRTYSNLYAGNLVLHEAILHSKSMGKTFFHLGGAGKSQEGLYKFKSRFSELRVPYFIGTCIHKNETYEMLVQQYKEHFPDQIKDDAFFPKYR